MDGAPEHPPGHGHADLPPGAGVALAFMKLFLVVVLLAFHLVVGLFVAAFFVLAWFRRSRAARSRA